MDHAYIEENQVVDRYLMERLSTAEVARFEAHYLDCQQCLDQLEVAETFLHDFRQSAAREAVQAAGAGAGILAWLVRHRGYQLALLAAMVLAAFLVPASYEYRLAGERQARDQLTEELARAHQPQTDVPVLPLRRERDASTTRPSHQIRLGTSPEWIVLSLELDDSQQAAGTYRVTLIDESDTEIWESPPFAPDTRGRLSLSLHSSWLGPGDYRLRAESPESSAELATVTYSFRVLPNQ